MLFRSFRPESSVEIVPRGFGFLRVGRHGDRRDQGQREHRCQPESTAINAGLMGRAAPAHPTKVSFTKSDDPHGVSPFGRFDDRNDDDASILIGSVRPDKPTRHHRAHQAVPTFTLLLPRRFGPERRRSH